jgi:cobalamin-dependent methionine synthase I
MMSLTSAFNTNSAIITLETIRTIRDEFPDTHITMGLSNLSFGLPARSYVNRSFLTLALHAGLDSVIIDPTDRELMASIKAAELVLGRDRHCLNYIRAYRNGIFRDNAGSANKKA